MRRAVLGSLAFSVLASGGVAGAALPTVQEPASSAVFPTRAEAVTVDVVVVDGEGRPVKGLSRADFVVKEDGVPRDLVGFEEVTPAASSPVGTGVAGAVATNEDARPERGRVFLVVFDDEHLTPLEAGQARVALDRFLDMSVHAGDHVTLLATSGGVRRSARLPEGLAELHDWIAAQQGRCVPVDPRGYISAWEAYRVHVLADKKLTSEIARRLREVGLTADYMETKEEKGWIKSLGLTENGRDMSSATVEAMATMVYTDATKETRATLESLRDALEALSVARGRKTVLLVSQGFFRDPSEPLYAAVADAAQRANAAVDFLDAWGSNGLPSVTSIEMERSTQPQDTSVYSRDRHEEEGTESLALETGGLIRRGPLDEGLERAARESESYYLLGYEPTWRAADGRFHRIAVEVSRPGVKVRARRGYHATAPSPSPGGVHPDVANALESPLEAAGVPLRLASYVLGPTEGGRSLVVLAGWADAAQLEWRSEGDRFADRLETAFRVSPAEGGEPIDRDRRVAVKLGAEDHAGAVREGLPLLVDFELAPGRYQTRLVVRDEGSGRVGSVLAEVEVPGLGFRLTTPILTDVVRGEPGVPKPIPLARRTFEAGRKLYCSFGVVGAETGGGSPRVTFEVAVFRADGTPLARGPSQPLTPGPGGELQRMLAVSLEHAEAGEYELVLRARDERTGGVAERRERFEVTGGAVAAAAAALPSYRELVAAYGRGETTTAVSALRALGAERAREEARKLRQGKGCDARCAEAAVLMHTDAAVAAEGAGETELQLATAQELLESLPDGSEGRAWRRSWLLAAGYLREGQSRLPEALRFFEEAERVSPGDAEALLAQGTVAEVASLLPDLMPRTREAAPVGSDRLPEFVERAERERYETRALDLYERALSRQPELLEARLRRGQIEERRGKAAEARADLEAVAREAKEPYLRSLARLFLGELEEKEGRLEAAIASYRAAETAWPGFQSAGVALSRALERRGRRAESARVIERDLERTGAPRDDPWIGYHLGLAWRRDAVLDALKRGLGS
jgi:VWFA-related protein